MIFCISLRGAPDHRLEAARRRSSSPVSQLLPARRQSNTGRRPRPRRQPAGCSPQARAGAPRRPTGVRRTRGGGGAQLRGPRGPPLAPHRTAAPRPPPARSHTHPGPAAGSPQPAAGPAARLPAGKHRPPPCAHARRRPTPPWRWSGAPPPPADSRGSLGPAPAGDPTLPPRPRRPNPAAEAQKTRKTSARQTSNVCINTKSSHRTQVGDIRLARGLAQRAASPLPRGALRRGRGRGRSADREDPRYGRG